MILLVSHYTRNKGTTDFFRDYLISRNIKHYYLRHPFVFVDDLKYSELVYFDGKKEKTVSKYKKINNSILDMIRNFIISFYVSIKLNRKINKIFAFGSFNTLPFLLSNLFFKRKITFWGVDYSTKRFGNVIMNKIYLVTETVACRYSNRIFNSSPRQAEARMKFHGLKEEKSRIFPNGIEKINFKKDFSKYEKIGLLYIGSITKQHGIIDFVKKFYINDSISYALHIIGGGEKEKELNTLVKENNLQDKVKLYGFLTQSQIQNKLIDINEKLFGIAPYSDKMDDLVYYRDSLKIREYLNYNIPYIAPRILYVNENLKKFGFIYKNDNELEKILNDKLIDGFKINQSSVRAVLYSEYTWNNILRGALNKK